MSIETRELLAEIDRLLAMQGSLLFAKQGYDESAATNFGVALLDVFRLHGTEIRAAVAAQLEG